MKNPSILFCLLAGCATEPTQSSYFIERLNRTNELHLEQNIRNVYCQPSQITTLRFNTNVPSNWHLRVSINGHVQGWHYFNGILIGLGAPQQENSETYNVYLGLAYGLTATVEDNVSELNRLRTTGEQIQFKLLMCESLRIDSECVETQEENLTIVIQNNQTDCSSEIREPPFIGDY